MYIKYSISSAWAKTAQVVFACLYEKKKLSYY